MVGLGTDIAGGYSTDIMNSMRHAVAVSRMRQGAHFMESVSGNAMTQATNDSLAITWKESLYLATRGGALSLGLKDVGEFKVGTPFDAQESMYCRLAMMACLLISPVFLYDFESSSGFGGLDFFDEQPLSAGITMDMIEKWWCMGDIQSRVGMWVQGKRLV